MLLGLFHRKVLPSEAGISDKHLVQVASLIEKNYLLLIFELNSFRSVI
jgi:hypothetical protein